MQRLGQRGRRHNEAVAAVAVDTNCPDVECRRRQRISNLRRRQRGLGRLDECRNARRVCRCRRATVERTVSSRADRDAVCRRNIRLDDRNASVGAEQQVAGRNGRAVGRVEALAGAVCRKNLGGFSAPPTNGRVPVRALFQATGATAMAEGAPG